MKFKTADLLEDDVPYDPVHDEIIGHGRWTVEHRIVFARDGKFWQTEYNVGATENQEQQPWEYETEVECREVVLQRVLVDKWMVVK